MFTLEFQEYVFLKYQNTFSLVSVIIYVYVNICKELNFLLKLFDNEVGVRYVVYMIHVTNIRIDSTYKDGRIVSGHPGEETLCISLVLTKDLGVKVRGP